MSSLEQYVITTWLNWRKPHVICQLWLSHALKHAQFITKEQNHRNAAWISLSFWSYTDFHQYQVRSGYQDPTDTNSQSSFVYNPYHITISSQKQGEDDDLIKSLKAKEREELSARYQDFRAHHWHQFSPSLWPDRSWQPFQWTFSVNDKNPTRRTNSRRSSSWVVQEDSQRPWVWQDWIVPTGLLTISKDKSFRILDTETRPGECHIRHGFVSVKEKKRSS